MTTTRVAGSELQIGDKFNYAGLIATVVSFNKEFKTCREATIRHEQGSIEISVRNNCKMTVQR